MDECKNLRNRLFDYHLSYVWLINMMRRKGFDADKSMISSAINGALTSERTKKIVQLGNEILDTYEKTFLSSLI